MLNFFDRHLKNIISKKNSQDLNQKIWNISLSRWDDLNKISFPKYTFGFQSDGLANVDINDGSMLINEKGIGFVSIVNDPWRPAFLEGGHLGPNPGIFNRKELDERFDVAVFQTNPIKKDIQFSGIPTFETYLKCDQESFDICVAISIIDKNDNLVKQFCTGFLRVSNNKPNMENYHTLTLQPTNLTIYKGNKIRVSISAAAWPAIGVNPGYECEIIGPPSINHKITTLNFNLKKTIMKIAPFF